MAPSLPSSTVRISRGRRLDERLDHGGGLSSTSGPPRHENAINDSGAIDPGQGQSSRGAGRRAGEDLLGRAREQASGQRPGLSGGRSGAGASRRAFNEGPVRLGAHACRWSSGRTAGSDRLAGLRGHDEHLGIDARAHAGRKSRPAWDHRHGLVTVTAVPPCRLAQTPDGRGERERRVGPFRHSRVVAHDTTAPVRSGQEGLRAPGGQQCEFESGGGVRGGARQQFGVRALPLRCHRVRDLLLGPPSGRSGAASALIVHRWPRSGRRPVTARSTAPS